MGFNSKGCTPTREKDTQRRREESHVKTEPEIRVMCLQSPGMPDDAGNHQKLGERCEQIIP